MNDLVFVIKDNLVKRTISCFRPISCHFPYSRHFARRRHRRGHATTSHASSHVGHEKRVALSSFSMYVCCSVTIVVALRLMALRAAGATLLAYFK